MQMCRSADIDHIDIARDRLEGGRKAQPVSIRQRLAFGSLLAHESNKAGVRLAPGLGGDFSHEPGADDRYTHGAISHYLSAPAVRPRMGLRETNTYTARTGTMARVSDARTAFQSLKNCHSKAWAPR